MTPRTSVSIVLPAHNEEGAIERVVTECLTTMTKLGADFEVIVVDDGSRDRTGEIADRMAREDPHVRPVHTGGQRGYGGALRAGFAAARKRSIFFMDADGQFDIGEIAGFIALRETGHAAVIGYRARRSDPLLRRLNARAWGVLVRAMLHFTARDVDCAFKLYDAGLLRRLDPQSAGAMINTEMLAKLARLGVTPAELPVSHFPRTQGQPTGANPLVILRAFRELARFQGDLRRWQPAPAPAAAAVEVDADLVGVRQQPVEPAPQGAAIS